MRSHREPSQLRDSEATAVLAFMAERLAELPQQIEHLGGNVLVDRPLIDGFQGVADLTDRRTALLWTGGRIFCHFG